MICPFCGRPMFEVDSCAVRPGVLTRAEERDRLVQAELEWIMYELVERCHQCEAATTGYHHLGCPVEFCFTHEEQRLLCGCNDELLPPDWRLER